MNIFSWTDQQVKHDTFLDGVDIWYAWLDHVDSTIFEKTLSSDEQNRAKRYNNVDVKNRFVAGRGILRNILGKFLNVDPASLVFSTTKFGRPFLAVDYGGPVDFNVSHSGNLMVIAISETRKVGIDLESVNKYFDTHAATALVFAPEEIAYLTENSNQTEKFYDIWTRKEAVLKTTGLGFSYPAKRFSVISSKSQSFLPWISGEVTKGNRCDIVQFSPFDGYTGALATLNQ